MPYAPWQVKYGRQPLHRSRQQQSSLSPPILHSKHMCGIRRSFMDISPGSSTIRSCNWVFPVHVRPVASTSILISLPGEPSFLSGVFERARSLYTICWKNGMSPPFQVLYSMKSLSHSVYAYRQACYASRSMVLRWRNEKRLSGTYWIKQDRCSQLARNQEPLFLCLHLHALRNDWRK